SALDRLPKRSERSICRSRLLAVPLLGRGREIAAGGGRVRVGGRGMNDHIVAPRRRGLERDAGGGRRPAVAIYRGRLVRVRVTEDAFVGATLAAVQLPGMYPTRSRIRQVEEDVGVVALGARRHRGAAVHLDGPGEIGGR